MRKRTANQARSQRAKILSREEVSALLDDAAIEPQHVERPAATLETLITELGAVAHAAGSSGEKGGGNIAISLASIRDRLRDVHLSLSTPLLRTEGRTRRTVEMILTDIEGLVDEAQGALAKAVAIGMHFDAQWTLGETTGGDAELREEFNVSAGMAFGALQVIVNERNAIRHALGSPELDAAAE